MSDSITQAREEKIQSQVKDVVARVRERRDKKTDRITKIKSAKADLLNLFTSGSDVLDQINEALGDKSPEWIEETSSFMKEATDVLEKTSILLGMTKSANVTFWLALVQVLVDEAKSSLQRQDKYLSDMVAIISRFRGEIDKITTLLSGANNQDALKFAYEQVLLARDSLMTGKDTYMAGSRLIRRFTDQAIAHLEVAERRLLEDIDEFNEIPSLEQFRELLSFITAMYPALLKLAQDYGSEYLMMKVLIDGIYIIDRAVRKNIELIDKKLTEDLIDKVLKSIKKKTETPLGAAIQKWNKSPPSQAAIVWNEMKYVVTIKSHYRKIRSYFGDNFENLSNLEIASDSYKNLVSALKLESYVSGDVEDKPKEATSVAVRIGAPSLNVFSLGQKSSAALDALSRRGLILVGGLRSGVSRTMTILDTFGPHSSTFLTFLNNNLKALGYEGEPIQSFATGNLINIPVVSSGIPDVRGVGSSGNTVVSGIAFYVGKAFGTTVGEKAVSEAIAQSLALEEKIEERAEKKQQRNVEQVMDDLVVEDEAIVAQLDEQIKNIEAGMLGEKPEEWFPDNRGSFA